MTRPKLNSAQGFTLIELLVVIAIIAILAAILFPVFSRARENARRTSCLSNMKQIGIGIMQYTQDYDERYPRFWGGIGADDRYANPDDIETDTGKPGGVFLVAPNPGGAAAHYRTWMDFVYPYVKNVQIFICPSRGQERTTYGYSVAFSGYSNYTSQFGGPDIRSTPISAASVTHSAEVMVVVEYTSPYNYTTDPYNVYSNAINTTNDIVTPHLEGGTAAYADGHAKWRPRGAIIKEAPNVGGACNLNAPNFALRYCSRAWNPYIP